MDWLKYLKAFANLKPETRDKIYQVISLVAELTQDPDLKAFLDALKQ